MESRYSVRQAADMTGVKPYVLRYWEEELGITIKRNEMGHRYYTGEDIQLISSIKELKRKGLQLRAIKDLLPDMRNELHAGMKEKKQEIVKETLKQVTDEAVADKINNEPSESKNIKDNEEEKILEFQSIMERLILRELSARDEEEEKCRSLDMAIRRQQLVRKEAAVSSEKKNGKSIKIHRNSR